MMLHRRPRRHRSHSRAFLRWRRSGRASRAAVARDRRTAGRLRARKVRRLVRHVEPWSVLKVALIFYFCLWVILLIAGVMLWSLAVGSGTVDNIETFITELAAFDFTFNADQIFRASAIGGLVLVVAGAGFGPHGGALQSDFRPDGWRSVHRGRGRNGSSPTEASPPRRGMRPATPGPNTAAPIPSSNPMPDASATAPVTARAKPLSMRFRPATAERSVPDPLLADPADSSDGSDSEVVNSDDDR